MRFVLPLAIFLGWPSCWGWVCSATPGLALGPAGAAGPAIALPLLEDPCSAWNCNLCAARSGCSMSGPRGARLAARNCPCWPNSQRDRVPVYGLNYKDQPDKARALLRVAGNPYRASAVDADGRVGMDFGIQGVPETFVIDGQGRVRFRHTGPVTAEIWRDQLLPVIRKVE